MKLYEISQELEQIRNLNYDEETNFEELEKTINKLKDKLEVKALNIACLIKSQQHFLDALEKESKRISKKKANLTNTIEWLKNYLTANLHIGKRVEDHRAVISWRKSKAVQINCEYEYLPDQYKQIVTEVKPKKALIRQDIEENHIEIPHCSVIEKQNIQIK